MYQHCDVSDEYISLHDSHAESILYQDGVITFVFPDGIRVTNEHSSNKSGKVVRTDKAEVRFYLESDDEDDIQEEWELSKLMDHVNNKKGTLEFLYQYKGYNSMIIECALWSHKKPYYRECELKLRIKDVNYCWNNLCENRVW